MKRNSVMTGAEIRKWRESFGWSQTELARRSDTNQQTVDRIERGLTKHSRAAGSITEAIERHLDTLDNRIRKSEAIKKANFKLKASPVPTSEHTFPVFIYWGQRNLTLAYYSQLPTAFVDDPGEYSIQVDTDDLPPILQNGDYLFFSSDAPIEVDRIALAFRHSLDKDWEYYLGAVVRITADEIVLRMSQGSEETALPRDQFHFVAAISIFNLKTPLATSSL
jgi:transcriptional regulator with XRE-family HTH domain